MTTRIQYLIGCIAFCFLISCSQDKKKDQQEDQIVEKDAVPQTENFTYHKVIPAEFPKLEITGFKFPQDSVTLKKWIQSSDENKIYLHGWGIWTGLTTLTNQKASENSGDLRVYETWLTPEEMIDEIKSGSTDYISDVRSNRANLRKPRQLTHFAANTETVNDSIHESVSYSPAAAKYAIDNKIFMATTLHNYAVSQGRKEIPFFPSNAITIKPVFKLLPASDGETSFKIAAWDGTTEKLEAFPEKAWNSSVTIDITDSSQGVDSIFNLGDFIHYKLNKEDAHFFNQEFTENEGNKFDAEAGDIAILVGMHVGTREITNWTWQTFWWDANPDNPKAPSSKAIADMKPKELKGAARHYSMAVAYYMVNPNEPYESKKEVMGKPNYAFNPYLEAGFGPGTFDKDLSYIAVSSKKKIDTYVGVRTNCMSCHRMSTVNPEAIATNKNSKTPYVGNAYISRADSLFKGQLLLDFAWSVQGNVDTTGFAKYIAELEGK